MTDLEQLPKQEASKQEQLEAVLQSRQVVCMADTPTYDSKWFSDRESWLLSKGWEREPSAGIAVYRDPKGSRMKGEMRVVKELPVKGDDLKKTETLRQFHVPPMTYCFTLEEALDIQRRREIAGDTGLSLQERLGECEKRCNGLEEELTQFKSRVKALLTTHQLSHEGLKLGLREMIGA